MTISGWRATAEVIAVLGAAMAGLIGAAIVFGSPYASPFGMLAGVAAALFFVGVRGEPLSDFGFRGAGLFKTLGLAVGVFAFAVALFLYVEPVLERWFGPIDFSIFAPLEGNAPFLAFMLVVSWVGAAFGEEVVYRGFIMTRIAQAFSLSSVGWGVAIVVQAALFAVAHSYQGMVGVIEIFILAIVLGLVYLAAGRSLWPVIIAHGLLDTFGMMDFYLGGALSDAIAAAGR